MSSLSSGGATLSDAEVQKIVAGLDTIDDKSEKGDNTMKIVLMCLMFAECWLGLLPKACGACSKNQYPLSFLNCFSAGIFLAMALMHVMPEAAETYEGWAECNGYGDAAFPLPYLTYMVGYVFILIIDRWLAAKFHIDSDDEDNNDILIQTPATTQMMRVPKTKKKKTSGGGFADAGGAFGDELKEGGEDDKEAADDTSPPEGTGGESKRIIRRNAVSKSSGVILALALGIHSFFEGMAFGLMDGSVAGQLAAGILIHKGAACISLGGAFARTGYELKHIALFLGVFSVTAPIGIIIGIALTAVNPLINVVFLSISGGTFLYVACSEIIVNEFGRGYYQWAKVLFVIGGIAAISLLWLLEGAHSHASCPNKVEAGHEGHDDH